MLRPRASLPIAALAGVLCVPSLASAQTVAATSQPYPDRSEPLRPQNLNPQGVSYSDCIADMTLTFHVTVSGFDGAHNLQIWASKSSDCTATTDRGIGASAAVCWLLPGGFTAQPYQSPQTKDFTIRVQDILAWQNTPPFPPVYKKAGAEACTQQSTYAALPININFLPMDSSNTNTAGTAYQYTLQTDTVGPPAPTNVTETVGHTLFNVNWNINTDTDTAGYNVFIDPIPGQETAEGGALVADSGNTITICPDTGSPAQTGTDSGDDGSTADSGGDGSPGAGGDGGGSADATTDGGVSTPDAGVSTPSDAGCYTINHGGSPSGGNGYSCNDPVLASGITQDAGSVPAPQYDDAGNLIEGGSAAEGSGGISTIPDAYRVGNTPTVPDKSRGSYTITGLQDGTQCPGFGCYNVVVAAVDGYGNVGPPSAEVCDFPAPVNDFWQQYGADGGKAGGFCSLDAVGVGGTSLAGVATAIGALGIVRRRRRRAS